MNFSNLSKFVGAGVIAASLTVVPLTLPAHAQNNTSGTSTQQNGTADATGPISTNTERDNNNWGWLGLLGLAGLAGLAKKKHQEVHHVSNDPNVGVRSSTDYR
ncbi:MAG TPA: WGxxGxxG family protein [Candidatus Sericytochromatia bacterium]|jgi:LPXTG-motif cell wall-anchored protein